jgi:hypothetical protein
VLTESTIINNNGNSESDTTKTLKSPQAENLPENTLVVEISDALSEKDRVKFTVHTKTTMVVSESASVTSSG